MIPVLRARAGSRSTGAVGAWALGSTAPASGGDASAVTPRAHQFHGNAAPLATLQTFAWACDRGDVETVDEMAASVLTHRIMVRPFPIAEVLATATPEVLHEGRVRLRLPNLPKDRTEYQKTGDGRKYALTGARVDACISGVR